MLVETKVGRLFVEARGEGEEALLLWHAFLCDGGLWRHNLGPLSERYRVINIDGPGHGRSAAVRAPFTLEDCADAAVEIMDALSIDRAHFAGLSWGGMVGMRLALRHRSRLRSLILLDSRADREPVRNLPSFRLMAFVARRVGAIEPLIDRIEPLCFTDETLRDDPATVEAFRDHLARMDPSSLGHCADAILFDREDIRGLLRAIDRPTLVVVGREDRMAPVRCSREIAREVAGAKLVVIDSAGHFTTLEQPDAVNRAMLGFLDACGEGRPRDVRPT